ncbi:hypothetical protein TWF481_008585 [Arthrobotrys musiformis]|uniref:Dienelactone hydrolase domain-containing protein n=1 Tax=Arthrobotrys musiformis TaxID=47236 RepID=A0AAV9W923_9PEZI
MDKVCEACKTLPPILDQDSYQEKGGYEDVNGLKCYIAAPQPTPETGILFVFDIFGYYKQTLQGADILALTDPGHVVVMPDFFFGKPMDVKLFESPEGKEALGSFFQNEGDQEKAKTNALKVLAGLKQKFPTVKKWGIFGLCWGGKATTLISKDASSGFAASAQAHPALLDPKDFGDFPVPHLCLSSMHENKEDADEVNAILGERNDGSLGKIYPNDIHGWMGARSNLKNEAERESYEKGYADVVEFFKKTLS